MVVERLKLAKHPLKIAVDLDDTILGTDRWDLDVPGHNQQPIGNVVACLKWLRSSGVKVVIFTSRKSSSREQTIAQLAEHDIEYDKIVFDKPQFDLFVDNKAMMFQGNWSNQFTIDCLEQAMDNRVSDIETYPMLF